MKIIMTVMAVLLFPVGGLFAQSVAVSPSPKSYSVVGSGDASLGMTRWPNFVSYSSDNPGCGEMLKKVLSKQLRAGTPAPAAISGLTLAIDFKKDIGTAYNKTAAIMVTWTVRIEGAAVEVNPWTWGLCSPWHGSVTEDFSRRRRQDHAVCERRHEGEAGGYDPARHAADH